MHERLIEEIKTRRRRILTIAYNCDSTKRDTLPEAVVTMNDGSEIPVSDAEANEIWLAQAEANAAHLDGLLDALEI